MFPINFTFIVWLFEFFIYAEHIASNKQIYIEVEQILTCINISSYTDTFVNHWIVKWRQPPFPYKKGFVNVLHVS